MKKKVFPYESLLKVREQNIKILQKDLAGLLQIEIEILEDTNNLKSESIQTEKDIFLKRKEGKWNEQSEILLYQEYLQKKLSLLEEKLRKQEQKIFLKKQELADALKERKMVEKLKEKHYSHWRQREIQNDSDEKNFFLPPLF